MSQNHSVNTNNINVSENDFDNDDLTSFQLESEKINLSYSQLVKYSKHVREKYVFSDILNRLPHEIHKFQEEYPNTTEIFIYFFKLLKENFVMNDNSNLTYKQCVDLLKISKYFEIRKLTNLINEYIKKHNVDVDFIIQMIQYDICTNKNESEINIELENLLSKKINECLTNEKFKELPISTIHRILKRSSPNIINSDKILQFIKNSMSEFSVLFSFLKIEKLSQEGLEELIELYSKSNEKEREYFNYMNCNLDMIIEMNNQNKNLSQRLKTTENTNENQQTQIDQLHLQIQQLQKELNATSAENQELHNHLKETETNKNEIEDENKKLQNKLIDAEKNQSEITKEKDEIQKKLLETEKMKKELEKRLEEEIFQIKGEIEANVKNGLIIHARIKLKPNKASIDFTRSKYIISKSDAQTLGKEAYEKGESITSNEMNTKEFICKTSTYYVRCIVFDERGKSTEIVSKSVRTSGSSVSFTYEGQPRAISLIDGQYKLEVWGAKGGNCTGSRLNCQQGEGGLGGYSRGILRLKEPETAYIYVGGEGIPSNPEEGSTTEGGFPDGGGTKTGHVDNYTSSPGTGGGSTSIRLQRNSEYSRIIVAGGGGGASGDYQSKDDGGFGGGLTGGNCSYDGSLKNQGSGTQTGSSYGLGKGSDGDPGQFNKGATGKYITGSCSGGGGGGGWYGGGSGGHGKSGSNRCSSGGGGSGWIFTESSYANWKSGDSTNASKFILNSAYYLTDAITISGDKEFPRPDGNGTECGHSGNGYAIITPE